MKAEIVRQLLAELLKHYQELLINTKRQADLIQLGQFEELGKLLNSRKEIMEQIDQLMIKIEAIKEEYVARYGLKRREWLSGLQENKLLSPGIKSVIERLYQVRAENQEIDRDNRKLIDQKRLGLSQEMHKLQKGIKINNKYHKNKRIYSSFFDKRS